MVYQVISSVGCADLHKKESATPHAHHLDRWRRLCRLGRHPRSRTQSSFAQWSCPHSSTTSASGSLSSGFFRAHSPCSDNNKICGRGLDFGVQRLASGFKWLTPWSSTNDRDALVSKVAAVLAIRLRRVSWRRSPSCRKHQATYTSSWSSIGSRCGTLSCDRQSAPLD